MASLQSEYHAQRYANIRIGVLIIATHKYVQFVRPLIESARKYLLPGNIVTYYIFTDSKDMHGIGDDVVILPHKHHPWPGATLFRYDAFNKHQNILQHQDYLFYCDCDMLFVDTVGNEILGDRTATIHPGFLGGRGAPETRVESCAYISPGESLVYYAGGFNGGTSAEFLKMSSVLSNNIKTDMSKDIIAIWHDESHMNRYFIDNPPTNILDSSYCYPEGWDLPFKKRLIALNKDHDKIRN